MFSNVKLKFWILILLCFLSLLLPILIRDRTNNLFIGSESYKSLRIADSIKNKGLSSYDKLSYGGKPLVQEKLWYSILSINPAFLAKILPFILGILSFILFYLIINKVKPDLTIISSLLLIFSPAFLYLFSTATKYSAAVFFILLGFYFMTKDKNNYGYVSFFISGFFSIISLLFIVFIFLFYSLKKEDFRYFYTLFFGFIVIFLIQFYNLIKFGIPQLIFGFEAFNFEKFFSFIIFGDSGRYGFGFFMFFLALIGIYFYYRERFRFLFVYFALFLVLLVSFYLNFLMAYLAFPLAFFGAIGIGSFLKEQSKSDLFKFLTLLVIICGLLFSLIVFYDGVSRFEPSKGYFEGINYLKNQNGDFTVLTDYKNGDFIAYAGKKTFIDSDFLYAPDPSFANKILNELYSTKDINATVELLHNYKIKEILIDENMKKDIFNNEEKGLLFLLKYSPGVFEKVFNNTEVEVWELKYDI